MRWFRKLIELIELLKMRIKPISCSPQECIDKIENSLQIELDPMEEDFVENLCAAGYHCEEICKVINFRRRRNQLRRRLKKHGMSDSDIKEVLNQSSDLLHGTKSVEKIFEKIKKDIEEASNPKPKK